MILRIFIFIFVFLSGVYGQFADFENYYCKSVKNPFFRIENKSADKMVFPAREGARNFSFPLRKADGKKRIFIVGESIAYFLYQDNMAADIFSSQKDFEFFNLGMIAYDSERIKAVVKESLKYNPDAIIIMSGNNEWLFDPCREFESSLKAGYINIRSNLADFLGDKRKSLFKLSIAFQERNIKEMITVARKKNVKVFIVLLPYNLFFPPFSSRPADAEYLKGYDFYERNDFKSAVEIFKKILKKDPTEPFANYYLGLSLYALKDASAALKHLTDAMIYDNKMDRTSPLRNEMLKKTAENYGAEFIDLEKYFKKISDGDIISSDFFSDGVHWHGGYNCHAQRNILNKLFEVYFKKKLNFYDCPDFKKRKDEKLSSAKFLSFQGEEINERIIWDMERYLRRNSKEEVFAALKKDSLKDIIGYENLKLMEEKGKKTLFYIHMAETFSRMNDTHKAFEILMALRESAVNSQALEVLASVCSKMKKEKVFYEIFGKYQKRINFFDRRFLKIVHFYGYDVKIAEEGFKINEKSEVKNSLVKAKKLSDKGVQKIKEKDLEGAKNFFYGALSYDKENFEALMNLAYVYMASKDELSAADFLERIADKKDIVKDSTYCGILNGLIDIYKKHRLDEKITIVQERAEICRKK